MTLIEDARRLDGVPSVQCDFCTGSPMSGHFEECPLRSVPRIVAVLEAMDEVLAFIEDEGCVDPCVDIIRRKLVAALRGEVVPSTAPVDKE